MTGKRKMEGQGRQEKASKLEREAEIEKEGTFFMCFGRRVSEEKF